jgi:hypothetical protein
VIEAALYDSRMSEVNTHPVGCVRFRIMRSVAIRTGSRLNAGKSNVLARSGILSLPVERVVIALVSEMKEAPDREEKVDSLLELFAISNGGGVSGITGVQQRFQPTADVHIAQATGAVLDAGLQVKKRVAVLLVALSGELNDADGDIVTVGFEDLRVTDCREALVDVGVAGKEPVIQLGERKFDIISFEFLGFGALACLG